MNDLAYPPPLATTQLTSSAVESALENVAPRETAKPDSPEPTTPRPRTVSLKRKKPETPAEDVPNSEGLPYNTRHKGQKRVCVTAEPLPRQTPVRKPRATAPRPATSSESISAGPAPAGDAPVKRGRGRPRKSAPTTSETVAVPSTSAAAGEVPAKRGRGRPRKSAPDAQPPPKSSVPSKRKEVFYGVVVSQRVHQYTEDDDADGEVDDDEDHVVVFQSGETSSLGSSNKGTLFFYDVVRRLVSHFAAENYPEPLSPEGKRSFFMFIRHYLTLIESSASSLLMASSN